MLLAGIVGHEGQTKTANLINSILSQTGKKISIVDSGNLAQWDNARISNYIWELQRNKVDVLIFKINIWDIEKEIFGNLHFDIIIYTDKADDFNEKDQKYGSLMRKAFSLLDEKGMAIVNVDDSELISFLQGMKHYFITYGFNSKASMTTSSIGDSVFKEDFMCCLQRTIPTSNGMLVEPQEFKLNLQPDSMDPYSVLAAAAFAVVNGIDLNLLNSDGQNHLF